jgi:chromosome partitioning protein
MKVWSIVNPKGGAGKTTLALHLAIAAAEDLKVLVIDLDSQESAERWHAIRQRATGNKDDPSIAAGPYTKLSEMLRTAKKLGADLVLIDTPPRLDKAIAAAIAPASLVLVPLRTSILDLQALQDCARVIDNAKARGKTAVILNAVPTDRSREATVKDAQRFASRHDLEVLPERLSDSPAYAQGLKSGRSATETNRNGKEAREINALLEALWSRDGGSTDD